MSKNHPTPELPAITNVSAPVINAGIDLYFRRSFERSGFDASSKAFDNLLEDFQQAIVEAYTALSDFDEASTSTKDPFITVRR